jgi:hypothetical protein
VKRPSFQFYPADWQRDTALQACSLEARGLWIEMICRMHDGWPYGYLRAGSKVIDETALARMVGLPISRCKKLLGELEAAGVTKRASDGAFFSSRMIRDEQLRCDRAAGGAKSVAHPTVAARMKGSLGPSIRAAERPLAPSFTPTFEPSPSSSSSASSSTTNEERDATPRSGQDDQAKELVQKFCVAYRRHREVPYAIRPDDAITMRDLLSEGFGPILDDLIDLFLTLPEEEDPWIAKSDRSVAVLAHKASWLAERLRRQPTIWDRVLEAIASKLSRHNVESWFKPLKFVETQGDRVIVAGSADVHRWIAKHYGAELEAALLSVGLRSIDVVPAE